MAWRSEGEPDLAISICAPTAMLDTDAGRELLAEANRAFGPGIGVEAPGTGQGATGAIDPVPWLAGTAAVLAGALVLVGVTIVARRPRA